MTKRNGHSNGRASANGKSATVDRAAFAKDPGRYVDQATKHGSVTITDAKGKPRVMIVVPKAIVDYDDR